jgi:hypothetical protein
VAQTDSPDYQIESVSDELRRLTRTAGEPNLALGDRPSKTVSSPSDSMSESAISSRARFKSPWWYVSRGLGFAELAASVLINLMFENRRSTYLPVLLTCVVIIMTLGLNVLIIDLVDIPTDSVYLVAELLGLIVFLNLAFVAAFVALERRALARSFLPSLRLFR